MRCGQEPEEDTLEGNLLLLLIHDAGCRDLVCTFIVGAFSVKEG